MTDHQQSDSRGVSRRDFIKVGGAVAAGIQIGAVAGAGLEAGRDPATHTGWQHLGEHTQFVDRKPLEIDTPPYEKVGPTRRPREEESPFGRQRLVMRDTMRARGTHPTAKATNGELGSGGPPDGEKDLADRTRRTVTDAHPAPSRQQGYPPMEAFSEPVKSYYERFPEVYDFDQFRVESILPKRREDQMKYGAHYTLIKAWSNAWETTEPITEPPEISDFTMAHGRPIPGAVPFKSPRKAAELIKKVTHHFGASMVGIARLNPNWCYDYGLRGSQNHGPYKVPDHWTCVIALGVPHQWEQVQSNPNCGTSYDAYSRASIAARRLEHFIKSLGYPARRHSPMDGYDLMAVPVLVDAGLGEQGRHGIVITPEAGSNFRAAFVTTNLPMQVDKPIDFGVRKFCEHCKICAEICPSNSISFAPDNSDSHYRGYRHWQIRETSCYNYWMQSMGGLGCRLCLIACPYSRKANWAHTLARAADTRDPTGLVRRTLTWMQKTFFKAPSAREYLPPPDGRFANYRQPPEWLQVKKYLKISAPDPTRGE